MSTAHQSTSVPGATSPTMAPGLCRSLAGAANMIIPCSPGLSTISMGDACLALTRGQFAQEFGGVLLDPTTTEVCLLFYPDTSEWRLPMGMPDTYGNVVDEPTSIVGCEPQAHAAQRHISNVTGYKCTHVHPKVAANTDTPCAYIGPQMVEPLALQIEQRTMSISPRPSSDTMHAIAGNVDAADTDDQDGYQRFTASQFVLTYYYMAWLTQSRFESKAATHPVGPIVSPETDSTINRLPARALPVAEVTWFKMDTAAQVLTHASDKLALREAIHRMVRLPEPTLPFAYSSVLSKAVPPAASECVTSDDQPLVSLSGGIQNASTASVAAAPATDSNVAIGNDIAPLSIATSAATDGETKADTGSRALSPVARNFDIIRKTAASLGKHRGVFGTRRIGQSPSSSADVSSVTSSNDRLLPAAAAAAAAETAPKKANVARVLSMFYKLVGAPSA